jgi:hypothetical protein
MYRACQSLSSRLSIAKSHPSRFGGLPGKWYGHLPYNRPLQVRGLNAAQPLNTMKRPFTITILGCLFIVAGLVGLVYHLSERPLDRWIVLISAIRIVAVVGGVFLLLGHNWARWIVLAWLLFHVVVSAFHGLSESIAHVVLLLVVGYFLLGPAASKYFQSPLRE